MLAQIGPYFIDEELAQGGMARVFKARLRGLGGFEKTLVVKQVRRELAGDPAFVAMFVREANTLVTLSHPHIVPVYELFSAEGTYYLSMEYVEGVTLAQLGAEGPLAPVVVAHLGAQICEALDYAHRNFGILHRDISPRNILVDMAGHARLVDFGIAGVGTSMGELWLGSPGYVAPEQARGEALSDATDIFALGAVLFEALTGKPAFEATLQGTLATLDAARFLALPEALRSLIRRMLESAPRERPQSAREVARELRTFLAQVAPQGVEEAVQLAVQEARRHRTPSAPTSDVPVVAQPVPTQSLATSPALTQLLRSAGGSPLPIIQAEPAMGHEAQGERAGRAEGTRRIRARGDGRGARWTRLGMRVWPVVALGGLVVLGGVSFLERPGGTRRGGDAGAGSGTRTGTGTSSDTGTSTGTSIGTSISTSTSTGTGTSTGTSSGTSTGTSSGTSTGTGTGTEAGASLTINASPWAEVRVDGKLLGNTPLRNVRLRPGLRRVELSCPPLGTRTTLVLDVLAGQKGNLVAELESSPPRTFLDGVRQVR